MLQKFLVEGRKNKVLNPQTANYILAHLPSYFIFERHSTYIYNYHHLKEYGLL